MVERDEERAPYGISLTKRLVSDGGENELFRSYGIDGHGSLELVDYMGGDEMVERVATAGHGREIFLENPESHDFLHNLVASGISEPFTSVQLKFSFQSPIDTALTFVYFPEISVNEYSGRYSLMLDSALPLNHMRVASMLRSRNHTWYERASEIESLLGESRRRAVGAYKELIDVDLARELARSVLGIDNDTRYFWKVNLLSLANFVREQRKRLPSENHARSYLEQVACIAGKVAPLSWSALMEQPLKGISLTMPSDDEIVDGPLCSPSWEAKSTRRISVTTMEDILFVSREVLDHGMIQAVDYMGDDNSLAEAARTSYGVGTVTLQDNINLIMSLTRDDHTTPIEMSQNAVEMKTPVFVDPRQAGRHRTLKNHGFMGITPIGSEFYFPGDREFKYQDRLNRQGRGRDMDDEDRSVAIDNLRSAFEDELKTAMRVRELGASEELVRMAKGVDFYTRRWRTGDTHNWRHFLMLRLDPHAQMEIRAYAEHIADFQRAHTPVAYEAFETYTLKGMRISSKEIKLLQGFFDRGLDPLAERVVQVLKSYGLGEENIDHVNKLIESHKVGSFIHPDDLGDFKGVGFVIPVDRNDPSKGKKLGREGQGFQRKLKRLLGE
ncbi:MAG: FAD-dependent thymidylate synthase [Nanoarchaeota archaeon]|nr:FAD-dependent thymidylate synthase [Nanoarchaeota archaeon]